MNRLARTYWMAKGVGRENLPRRIWQALLVRSGSLHRRLDQSNFSQALYHSQLGTQAAQKDLWLQRRRQFFPVVTAENLQAVCDEPTWSAQVVAVAEQALAGEYPFFSGWTGRLGWPPDFNLDPLHQTRWPVGRHWLTFARSGAPLGDIKLVWEASRLSLAYVFGRACTRRRDERYAEAFWQMLEAWVAQNPPELSAGWACGQEIAFRMMAMLFGALATLDYSAATPARLEMLSLLAWQSAQHIQRNLNGALMQGNNHGLSECLGLWTVGLLFGEFEQARRWRETALKHLAGQVARQVYDDGSFVQHSLNYHRLMLDDLLWVLRLAQINQQVLPPVIHDRFERASRWLLEMIDPASGRVPNYGANDGANVLPLSTCDYLDYRPTAQAACYLLHRKRVFESGPWDEKMLWLFGPEALSAPIQRPARGPVWIAPQGGYYILRGPESWAMTRCHTYRHRPSQADMLHVDLFFRGVNLLRDGGSYFYYHADPRWGHYFHSTAAHNTVQIGDGDQMTKGPRFLWFDWSRCQARVLSEDRLGWQWLELRLCGYGPDKSISHVRRLGRKGDCYAVQDRIDCPPGLPVRLRWRLAPLEWRREGQNFTANVNGQDFLLSLKSTPSAWVELLTGQEQAIPEGWESLYYGRRRVAPTIVAQAPGPCRFETILGPADQVQQARQELAGNE
jgi:hypothetical protein